MTTSRLLAPYVLRCLAAAQRARKPTNLEVLTEQLGVRRADVRATVSALHAEGLVDAATMRLTLRGFAIGTALRARQLPQVREALREANPAQGATAASQVA